MHFPCPDLEKHCIASTPAYIHSRGQILAQVDVVAVHFLQSCLANRSQKPPHSAVVQDFGWQYRLIVQFDLYLVALAGANHGFVLVEAEALLVVVFNNFLQSFHAETWDFPVELGNQDFHIRPAAGIEGNAYFFGLVTQDQAQELGDFLGLVFIHCFDFLLLRISYIRPILHRNVPSTANSPV